MVRMKEVSSPTAHNTAAALDDTWVSRYPPPQSVGYDGGGEFKEELWVDRESWYSVQSSINGIIE
jgi:hypothetical protein